MKQKEAKILIVQEWDRWVKTQSIVAGGPGGRDSLKFFFDLQDRRSPLLDFQSRTRDKWQVVHEWLEEKGRVSGSPHASGRLPRPKERLFRRHK